MPCFANRAVILLSISFLVSTAIFFQRGFNSVRLKLCQGTYHPYRTIPLLFKERNGRDYDLRNYEIRNLSVHARFQHYGKALLFGKWHLFLTGNTLALMENSSYCERDQTKELVSTLKSFGAANIFLLTDFRDVNVHTRHLPMIAKARPLWDTSYVLLPMHKGPHWGNLAQVDKHDVPYDEKWPILLWRGRTSGDIAKPFGGHRHNLLAKFFGSNRSDLDIKPARIDRNPLTRSLFKRIPQRQFEKATGVQSIQEMLKYRYLLSVEGNDVATGLKWMLYSRSVIFMPPPTVESWALEGWMQPWIEYVPVRHDFADLASKVEWCNGQGHDICRYTAFQGRKFIRNFLDDQAEEKLMRSLLEFYREKVQFHVAPSAYYNASTQMKKKLDMGANVILQDDEMISPFMLPVYVNNG